MAVANDATAAAWNPAGLGLLDRPGVSLGVDFSRVKDVVPAIQRETLFQGLVLTQAQSLSAAGVSFTRRSTSPDFVSILYPLAIGAWTVVPQFGYRRVTRMNFSSDAAWLEEITYDDGFAATDSMQNSLTRTGGIDVYAGAVGIGISRRFYVGATVNLWRGTSGGTSAEERRFIAESLNGRPIPVQRLPIRFTADYEETFNGTSMDVGVLLKPTRYLRVGSVLRSSFTLERTYEIERQIINFPPQVAQSWSERGTVDWPISLGVGVAVLPLENLTFAVDYTRTGWSDADYHYDISSTLALMSSPSLASSASGSVVYPTAFRPSAEVEPYFNVAQRDASTLHGGGEFVARRPSSGALPGISIRAGAYWNRSLLPQADGTDLAGVGFTGGLGFDWRQMTVDVAFVRESMDGALNEYPPRVRPLSFSQILESQRQNGADKSVLSRLLISTTARF